MKDPHITHYGSTTRIAGAPCNPVNPHAMRVETMLYPYHFPGATKRTEDAAVCLTVATDTAEYSQSCAVLLTKSSVAALIEVLSKHLAEMADAPDAGKLQ